MQKETQDFRKQLDMVLAFCQEAREGFGEDSLCHSFCRQGGLLGVFDGCGGLGGQSRNFYTGHTEAYMASRMVSGAVFDWFTQTFPRETWPARVPELDQEYIRPVITAFQAGQESGLRMKGSMSRPLPTTAAAALLTGEEDSVRIHALWAGDSRVYCLTPNAGLSQLTTDDCSQPDPMENLYDDGILTNVISADGNYTLNGRRVRLHSPCVVLAATDGCFGYVSTPMEFEGMLLGSLDQADSGQAWEEGLRALIASVAGDDYSIAMAVLGFGSFEALREAFRPRYKTIYHRYLEPVSRLDPNDVACRRALWQEYRVNYLRFLGGDRQQ